MKLKIMYYKQEIITNMQCELGFNPVCKNQKMVAEVRGLVEYILNKTQSQLSRKYEQKRIKTDPEKSSIHSKYCSCFVHRILTIRSISHV